VGEIKKDWGEGIVGEVWGWAEECDVREGGDAWRGKMEGRLKEVGYACRTERREGLKLLAMMRMGRGVMEEGGGVKIAEVRAGREERSDDCSSRASFGLTSLVL